MLAPISNFHKRTGSSIHRRLLYNDGSIRKGKWKASSNFPMPLLWNEYHPLRTVKPNLWHAHEKWHATPFWVSHYYSPTSNNLPHSHIIFQSSWGCTRTGCALAQPPEIAQRTKNQWEQGILLHCFWRLQRLQKSIFSKAISRRSVLCDLELPWLMGHGDLSRERGHCLRVRGMLQIQQILGIIHN